MEFGPSLPTTVGGIENMYLTVNAKQRVISCHINDLRTVAGIQNQFLSYSGSIGLHEAKNNYMFIIKALIFLKFDS